MEVTWEDLGFLALLGWSLSFSFLRLAGREEMAGDAEEEEDKGNDGDKDNPPSLPGFFPPLLPFWLESNFNEAGASTGAPGFLPPDPLLGATAVEAVAPGS